MKRAGGAWILSAAILLAVLVPASAQDLPFDEEEGEPALSWSDSLLYLEQPPECPASPLTPFDLPARPAGPSLGVIFADGRAARWDELVVLGDEPYWPLEECCAALHLTLFWDPALLRGRLERDSLSVRFAVGAEFLHCGETAIQMTGPVIYAENRLLLPLSGLARLVEQFLSDRYAFDARSLILREKPLGPRIGEVEFQHVGGRTYIRWSLPREPQADLSSDGARALRVDLPGLFVDPAAPPAPNPSGGMCLDAILADGTGTTFVFHADHAIAGWKTQWLSDRREFQVILTDRTEDLGGRAAFYAWPAAGAALSAADPRRVALVLPDDAAWSALGDGGEDIARAREFIETLGSRVEERLRGHGFAVEILRGRIDEQGTSWVPAANRVKAAACLALLPALSADSLAPGLRVVTAAGDPLHRPFTSLEAKHEEYLRPIRRVSPSGEKSREPVSLPRWDRLAARHGEASEDLAWLLSIHLRAALAAEDPEQSSPVVSQRWPVSALDGLDMPGVLLYVGRLPRPRAVYGTEDMREGAEDVREGAGDVRESAEVRRERAEQMRGAAGSMREGESREHFGQRDRFVEDAGAQTVDRAAEAIALSLEAFAIRRRGAP